MTVQSSPTPICAHCGQPMYAHVGNALECPPSLMTGAPKTHFRAPPPLTKPEIRANLEKQVADLGALDIQVAGDHYKGMNIQPVEYIHKNGIGYLEGNVIKYVSRWRKKGGRQDLEKARHYIDLLLDMEFPK